MIVIRPEHVTEHHKEHDELTKEGMENRLPYTTSWDVIKHTYRNSHNFCRLTHLQQKNRT